MIKQLLIGGLLFSSLVNVMAQDNMLQPGKVQAAELKLPAGQSASMNKSATQVMADTLYYFQRKHYLRNTAAQGNSYYTVLCPISSTAAGSGTINSAHGASFLNPSSSSVSVEGAAILTMRSAGSSATVPITVTLYTTSPTGVPGASVATATCQVTNSTNLVFGVALFNPPVTVTDGYFISYQPMNPATDTLRIGLTSAFTSTSNAPANQRFGEGLAYRKNGTGWNVNTNYYNTSPTTGSDLEPVVIPFVQFAFTATAVASAPDATANPGAYCANAPISFTNNSTGILENRQYNWNKFRKVWAPFSATITPQQADSIYNWTFSGAATPSLVATTKDVTHTYGTTGSANVNLITKYQKIMCAGCSSSGKTQDSKAWTYTVAECGIIGIQENTSTLSNVSVYPNPVVSGKVIVGGLNGKNTVAVYNLLGEVVSRIISHEEKVAVDFSNMASGTYFVKVTDQSGRTKTVKLINQ